MLANKPIPHPTPLPNLPISFLPPNLNPRNLLGGHKNEIYFLLGLNKLLLSTMKFIFQILLNRKRQSTDGLSPKYILTGVIGGFFVVASVLLKEIFLFGTIAFKEIKVPKLLLGLLNIFMQVYILYQIWLYREKGSKQGQQIELPGVESIIDNFTGRKRSSDSLEQRVGEYMSSGSDSESESIENRERNS